MTQTLPTLRTKYPRSRYAPCVGCQYCNGTGEVNGNKGFKPCVCLFVQHDLIEASLKVLPYAMYEVLGIDIEALQGKQTTHLEIML